MENPNELLFFLANSTAAAGWVLLIFLPYSVITRKLVESGALPLVLAAGYTVLIALTLGRGEGDFMSLAGVSRLFENEVVLLAGWVHYLAFDMLVGIQIKKQAEETHMQTLVRAPFLFLTFMLGPVGYLSFRFTQWFRRGRVSSGSA